MKFVFVGILIISIFLNIFATPVNEKKREKRNVAIFLNNGAKIIKKPISDVFYANLSFICVSAMNLWKGVISPFHNLTIKKKNPIEKKKI